MEHPDLWSATPEAPPPSRNGWLAGIHAVAQWAVRTPEFARHAASVTSGRRGSAFDEVLRDRLTANSTDWRPSDVVALGHVARLRCHISAEGGLCAT